MQNNKIYKSKVDLWLISIVILAFLILTYAGIHLLYSEGIDHPATWIVLSSSFLFLGVMLGVAYPVSYEITQSDLIIRSGLTKSVIELSSIESIKPSRNPCSSPAWSLDRLHINYYKKGKLTFILISPEDKLAFQNELALKNSNLSFLGDRVTSASR